MKKYRKRQDIIYRSFKDFCYLTDNHEFSYFVIPANSIREMIITSAANVLLSQLDYEFHDIDEIFANLNILFPDADYDMLRNECISFFDELSACGFLDSADNFNENSFTSETNWLNHTIRQSKHLPHVDEYLQKKFAGRPFLQSVLIELTTKCNERCIHCYIPGTYKIDLMKKEKVISLLNELREMNVLNVTLTGGEPMIHPDFISILRLCKELNFSVNILSNLTCLTDEILIELANNKLVSVQTSLYSLNPDVHDSITLKKGSWDKTFSAIKQLLGRHVALQINCPILKQNKESYRQVIEWGKSHNISVTSDHLVFAQINHCNDNLSCRLDKEEIYSLIEDRINNEQTFVDKIENDFSINDFSSDHLPVCNVGQDSICVSAKGLAYPCAGWNNWVIGDVNKQKVKNIWYRSFSLKLLRSIKLSDFPKCKSCKDKKFCTICLMKNCNSSPSNNPMEINDYFCESSHVLAKYYSKRAIDPLKREKE